MKKLLCALCAILILIPSVCFSAASSLVCTQTGGDSFNTMQLSCVWTAHSSAASFETVPLCVGTCTVNSTPIDFTGWGLAQVISDIGGTGPTDNSDLYLLEGSSSGRDVLGGVGLNFIDNADATPLANVQPWIGSEPKNFVLLFGPLYMQLSGNAVNSATGTLVFKFFKI